MPFAKVGRLAYFPALEMNCLIDFRTSIDCVIAINKLYLSDNIFSKNTHH